MKKLLILSLFALTLAACTTSTEIAPVEDAYEAVDLDQTFVAEVVITTKNHFATLYQMEIPATAEYWHLSPDGRWIPDMDLLVFQLKEIVDIPSEYKGEKVAMANVMVRPLEELHKTIGMTQKQYEELISDCFGLESNGAALVHNVCNTGGTGAICESAYFQGVAFSCTL